MPILPLFNLHFCKVCLRFSYTLFFLFLLAKIHAHAILPCHARHVWHLIDFKQFFLAKTLAKTCRPYHKNPKPLFLNGFLFVNGVLSLLKNAQAQIIITPHCCMLMQCYYIRQCYNATSNATIYSNVTLAHKNPKTKTHINKTSNFRKF